MRPKSENLTQAERDILKWVALGKSNAVIAGVLNASPHTIKTDLNNILQKLDVRDRVEAGVKAIRLGLV